MPESLKKLRRRVRSVKNTQQITRAMEMVSAAKLRRTQAALEAARPYARRLQTLLAHLAPAAEAAGHPFFAPRDARRSTLVIFTADRGLCGSYNSQMTRQAEGFIEEAGADQLELVSVGRRGMEYFSRRKASIAESFCGFGGALDRDRSNEIARFLRDRFLSGETDEVHLLYNSFVSTSVYHPCRERFLPLERSSLMGGEESAEREAIDYIFEPDRNRVFEKLLPAYLYSKIYITLAEALTSEHSARMLAMNNASKNCNELVDSLTLRLNKARQSAITADLLDIVGGAEALKA